ncbi:MAG: hypothetical protein FWC00_03340 [Firmicutes bacterium]|nr:hypothetical protein [Bacillota bacterium]
MEFFQIHVALWIFIVAQVFGFVYVGIQFTAKQFKDKSTTLKLYAVGNIFSIISNAMLLNWVLVGGKCVSFFKNLSFSWLQKNRERVGKILSVGMLLFFISAVFIVGIFTWDGLWFNWILMFMLSVSYFGEWHRNIHLLRIGSFLYLCAVFVNALMFANFADMVKCIVSTIAIIVFYIRFFRNRGCNPSNECDTIVHESR